MKLIIAVLALTLAAVAATQTVVLHSFTGSPDGSYPNGSPVSDAAGNLYGTTSSGGNPGCSGFGCGVIYEVIAPASKGGIWQETILYSFTGGIDGGGPFGSIAIGPDGSLYGTAFTGGNGYGVVWKLLGGVLSVLHNFQPTDGQLAVGGLLLVDGVLYGTTSEAIYRIDPDGVFTILHEFQGGNDGGYPGPLTLGPDGLIYGTTLNGGFYSYGTLFSLTTDGSIHQILYHFSSRNSYPMGGVTFDGQGNMFGTTSQGGTGGAGCSNGCGTLFEWTSGSYVQLYSFPNVPNAYPESPVILDGKGSIYSTTASVTRGCGSVWRWNSKREDFVSWSTKTGKPCLTTGGIIFGPFGGGYGASHSGGVCSSDQFGCGTVYAVYP